MESAGSSAVEAAVLEAQRIGMHIGMHRRPEPGLPAQSELDERLGARSARHRQDALYRRIFVHLEPRIVRLTQRYGLGDMPDDARQACAIAIHSAIGTYDPAKAAFTTHVTWAMRGELQSLRHRVRLDQRRSAKGACVSTVSLEGLAYGENDTAFEIIDEASLKEAERGASDWSTGLVLNRLMDRVGSPAHERAIVTAALFEGRWTEPSCPKQRERHRQTVRRTFRNCAKAASA